MNVSASIADGWTGPVDTAGARLVYAAAKSGILGLAAQLAKDVGAFDITVNAVLPWLTFGDQGSRICSSSKRQIRKQRDCILSEAPPGRAAEADGVAAAIALRFGRRELYFGKRPSRRRCLSLVLPISTYVFALRPLR